MTRPQKKTRAEPFGAVSGAKDEKDAKEVSVGHRTSWQSGGGGFQLVDWLETDGYYKTYCSYRFITVVSKAHFVEHRFEKIQQIFDMKTLNTISFQYKVYS